MTKLYRIYFISEAARARDLDAELDGVIRLTEKQAEALRKRGEFIEASDAGSFYLDPAEPYTFAEVEAELKAHATDEEIAEVRQ